MWNPSAESHLFGSHDVVALQKHFQRIHTVRVLHFLQHHVLRRCVDHRACERNWFMYVDVTNNSDISSHIFLKWLVSTYPLEI